MFFRTPIAMALAVAAPLLAHAQTTASSEVTDAPDGTDYVVTATRTPQVARDSLRPVTVITAQDIQQSGVSSVIDVLRVLGGVEVSSNGGMGHTSSVYIRGANSDHTALLIDGVRVGSATSGSATLEGIPLALIDRIEILPGPASSLYGSDAIGGVIQVFTKSPERSPGLSVAATAGSEGLRQWSATYAAKFNEGTSLSVGASSLSTDGINATLPSSSYYNADRDGFVQRSAEVRLDQRINADHEVGVNYLRSDGKAHYDSGSTVDPYTNSATQTLGLHWNAQLMPLWRSELRLARSLDFSSDHSDYPGTFNTTQQQLSWLNYVPVLGGTASAGLEWLKQSVESSTVYDETERTVRSGMVGWRGAFGAQSVQLDLREDRNSQFGDHTTGQVAWAWNFSQDWRVRAAWGSAFHAPSFNDLYYPGYANPDLQPEKSDNYELGLDGKLAGLDVGATIFDNHIRDLIDSVAPDYLPVNVDKAEIRGLTLKASGAIDKATRFKANLTWQDPENSDTHQQLARRSRIFAGLHLTHQFGRFAAGTDLAWVGKRYDAGTPSDASRMGAYGLVSLFGAWTITPQWQLEARLDNLTDRQYQTALGYRSAGRQGQVTLRWTPDL